MTREQDFKRLRRVGWRACEAFNASKTREIFEQNENVRLEIVEDDLPDFSDWGETESERKAVVERANHYGVWGIIGDYRLDESTPWIHIASVWGFIGDDWKDSGYDTDVMAETLQALDDARSDALENRRAFLILEKLRDREDGYYGVRAIVSSDEQRALTRILEAIKPQWSLSDL